MFEKEGENVEVKILNPKTFALILLIDFVCFYYELILPLKKNRHYFLTDHHTTTEKAENLVTG